MKKSIVIFIGIWILLFCYNIATCGNLPEFKKDINGDAAPPIMIKKGNVYLPISNTNRLPISDQYSNKTPVYVTGELYADSSIYPSFDIVSFNFVVFGGTATVTSNFGAGTIKIKAGVGVAVDLPGLYSSASFNVGLQKGATVQYIITGAN